MYAVAEGPVAYRGSISQTTSGAIPKAGFCGLRLVVFAARSFPAQTSRKPDARAVCRFVLVISFANRFRHMCNALR
jgi:hypothetical protein